MRPQTITRRLGIAPALIALLFAVAIADAPNAAAFKVVAETGAGAGQTDRPNNIAVDAETGRLYVTSEENNRVDVFDSEGNFELAFGWGVKNGKSELQVCTTASTCRKGIAGAGEGQFSAPVGIAVDSDPLGSTVYVTDRDNKRVDKFSEEGEFLLSFGGGVNQTTGGDVCTAASGDACGAGSAGDGEGEFQSLSGRPILVGVAPTGTVYVVDTVVDGLGKVQARFQRFDEGGNVLPPQRLLFEATAEGLAVDPADGDFWVTGGKGTLIHKYASDGSLLLEGPVPHQENGAPLWGASVGSEGHLFITAAVPQQGRTVVEFDSDGNPLRRFGYGIFQRNVTGLAVHGSAGGDIYASEAGLGDPNGRILHLDFPSPGPVIYPEACKADPLGNAKATLRARVDPENNPTTYHFELVEEETFQEDVTELGAGHGFDHATRVPEEEAEDGTLPSDIELHDATAETEISPETEYRCRVVASNADGSATGQEGAFTSLPPLQIGGAWVSEVKTEGATLNATVNPLGLAATAYFEYVDEATYQKDISELGPEHGFDHALKAPKVDGEEEEPIDLGAGEDFKVGSAEISGLQPGTSYRYRIVVTNTKILPEEVKGPATAFRTHRADEGGLPDGRAYELVSPSQKNSAEVAVPGVAGGLGNEITSLRIQAAADSGEAATYTSWTSFGDPRGAPSASQYLSKRTDAGWSTENISPLGFLSNALNLPYRGFSPDLSTAGFVMSEPPLAEGALEGFENLYLRDNAGGTLRALTREPAPVFTAIPTIGLDRFCVSYEGASADGSRAFFAANGAFTQAGAPTEPGFSLYERSPSGLQLVSVLPDGNPAPPARATRFGEDFGGEPVLVCSMGLGRVDHAVSADGKVVFWRYDGEYEGANDPLFARIEGKETVQLDAKTKGVKGPGGEGTFRAATPDGAFAFFSAPGKLTTTSGAAGHLYRYDTGARTLIDLTPGSVAAELQGVIGASEDGSRLYFVAKAALAGAAVKGDRNLYLWREGEGLRFIAALADLDQRSWNSAPNELTARVSPDGSHLAFLSVETEALSGYDNTVFPGAHCQPGPANKLEGDPRCSQAYLYDAEADDLTCVSCNPSGARPQGPAELPGWSNPFEGPRYLSDDGQRLFFESRDALSPADKNGRRDVYQFERAGSGSCTSQSPTFAPTSNGCLALISNGKSEDESYFVDASSNGRDVFFSTRSPLVGWDENPNYDVYDAREGGGFAEPPPDPPICEGEGCKPAPSTPSAPGPSPGTASFQGPGNPAAKHKAKKRKQKKRRHRARGKSRQGKKQSGRQKARNAGRTDR